MDQLHLLWEYQKADVEVDMFQDQYRQDLGGRRPRPGMPPRYPCTAYYAEGLLVGYRWFDTKEVPVMYAFGHGLSYVDFGYSDIKAKKKSDAIQETFKITNNGKMDADEVPQLYVHRVDATV